MCRIRQVALWIVAALLAGGCTNFLGDFHLTKQQDPGCVVVAGDSWALLDYLYESTEHQLTDKLVVHDGKPCHGLYSAKTVIDPQTEAIDVPLVLPGTRARQWSNPIHRDWIANALIVHPEANVVFLYVGGNDIILPFGDDAVVIPEIAGRIETIIASVQAKLKKYDRTPVPFIVVGYTRPNFIDETGDHPKFALRPISPNVKQERLAHQIEVTRQFSDLADELTRRFAANTGLNATYLDNRCLHIAPCPGDGAQPLDKKYMAHAQLLGYYFFVNSTHLGVDAMGEISTKAVCLALQKDWLTGKKC